jgi:hypothetical protein
MTRGGYLVIIGVFLLAFMYQNHANNKMISLYDSILEQEKVSDSDTLLNGFNQSMTDVKSEIQKVYDSIQNIKPDTIIQRRVIIRSYGLEGLEALEDEKPAGNTNFNDLNNLSNVKVRDK